MISNCHLLQKLSLIFLLIVISLSWKNEIIAGELALSWTDSSNNESGFGIERKTGTAGTFTQIAILAAGVSSYTDSGLVEGTTYCYRLRAFNTAGNSAYSNEACATARPTLQPFALSITKAGTGSGAVTSAPAGINCGTSCSGSYNSGTVVSLTATAATGSSFAGWNGDADCSDGSVTMNANKNCIATFNLIPQAFTLTVNLLKTMTIAGTGSGTVTSTPAGINCGTDCSENYGSGTSVKLTATPAAGSTFAGWSGDPDCSDGSVTMNASKSCTASFNLTAQTVALSVTKAGSGTVMSTPAGVNCGTDCSESYSSGTVVTLTASPAEGSKFLGWSGGICSGTGTCTVTLTKNTSVTATFDQPTVQLTTRIGIFRPTTGEWYLDQNGNGIWDGCEVDRCSGIFGRLDDIPVVGDWSGKGVAHIGFFRPDPGRWFLDLNGNGKWDGCKVDRCLDPGRPGDLPVVGDWSSKGMANIGFFRPDTGEWFLDLNGNGKRDGCKVDRCLGPYGRPGDLPVVGDWTGAGKAQIGVFEPNTGIWHLDLNGNGVFDDCTVDACLGPFGQPGDLPVAGDWTGAGKAQIGVFEPNTGIWHLDLNENGVFDGCTVDACLGPFGQQGDLPVVGKW
jgi:Divergent InlB B-repeat domain